MRLPILASAAGVVWLIASPPSWLAGMETAFSNAISSAPAPAPKLDARVAPKKLAHLSLRRRSSSTGAPVEIIEVPVNTSGPASAPKRVFPLDQDVPRGTTQLAVLQKFGTPDLRVMLAEAGELRERYIYIERSTGRLTFVSLTNATVMASQTE